MAQQVITRYTDDLDGSDASGSVGFAVDGCHYKIDLSDENAAKLREVFAPFVAAARRADGRRARRVSPAAAPAGPRRDLVEARGWLRDNGYPVKDRGRVPDEWIGHFDARTPHPPPTSTREQGTDTPGNHRPQQVGNPRVVEFRSA